MTQPDHQRFMRRAVELSREGMSRNLGGPFGAVIVREGQIVGEAFNRVLADNDPTAHAEVMAIRNACRAMGHFELGGCAIYTSCEPCPMCLGAIYWARLPIVYYANTAADAHAIGADDAVFYAELAKPPDQRATKMIRVDAPDARAVFDEWLRKADRRRY